MKSLELKKVLFLDLDQDDIKDIESITWHKIGRDYDGEMKEIIEREANAEKLSF